MANNPHVATLRRNQILDTLSANLNSGFLDIFDGSQPSTADTAISSQVKLAHLTFGSTAFASASSGSATANAITADTDADATGTAAWARWYKSDATTAVLDCSVGTSGCDINFNSVAIQIHAQVSMTSLTLSMAA